MDKEVTYIGIDQEPEVESKVNKPVKPKKEKFRTKKRSGKLNRLIRGTKNTILNKDVLIFIAVILILWLLNPVKYVRDILDTKRALYNSQTTLNENGDLSINFSYLSGVDLSFGAEYYRNCQKSMEPPVDGMVSYQYDLTHKGVDFVSHEYPGKVFAAYGGTVCHVGYSNKYKHEVTLMHNINGTTVYTFYGNLSLVNVSIGQTVAIGQVIGQDYGLRIEELTSGGGIFDPDIHHLHFEVRKEKDKGALNPMIFLRISESGKW